MIYWTGASISKESWDRQFSTSNFPGENSTAGIVFKEIHWRQFLGEAGYFPDTTKYVLGKVAQMEKHTRKRSAGGKNMQHKILFK